MSLVGTIALWTVTAVVAFSVTGQVSMYISAVIELTRTRRSDRHRMWQRMLTSPLAPRISVLVPAYNEELSIVASVSSTLALTYQNLEVVVVNDGSTDTTMAELIAAFELSPLPPVFRNVVETQPITTLYRSANEDRLIVVDKHNGGKADALNAALNVSSGELVCAIDADTVVAPNALHQLVAPFLESADTVAVGGTVRLHNGAVWENGMVKALRAPKGLLEGAQAVEYSRAFLVGRLAWNPLGGNLIISGAFGLFRRESLQRIGGYQHGSVGEDMELIVRLRRVGAEEKRGARVIFTPEPVAYTEAPTSLLTLARQRNRWYRGLLEVLTKHRTMILNPRYGSAGMVAMPYFVIIEAVSPIVEALGFAVLLVALLAGWTTLGAMTPLFIGYCAGLCASFAVLTLDDLAFNAYERTRDRVRMAGYTFFEQTIFRPMTVIWRLWGLTHFLRGRSDWGVQERKGFAS